MEGPGSKIDLKKYYLVVELVQTLQTRFTHFPNCKCNFQFGVAGLLKKVPISFSCSGECWLCFAMKLQICFVENFNSPTGLFFWTCWNLKGVHHYVHETSCVFLFQTLPRLLQWEHKINGNRWKWKAVERWTCEWDWNSNPRFSRLQNEKLGEKLQRQN